MEKVRRSRKEAAEAYEARTKTGAEMMGFPDKSVTVERNWKGRAVDSGIRRIRKLVLPLVGLAITSPWWLLSLNKGTDIMPVDRTPSTPGGGTGGGGGGEGRGTSAESRPESGRHSGSADVVHKFSEPSAARDFATANGINHDKIQKIGGKYYVLVPRKASTATTVTPGVSTRTSPPPSFPSDTARELLRPSTQPGVHAQKTFSTDEEAQSYANSWEYPTYRVRKEYMNGQYVVTVTKN